MLNILISTFLISAVLSTSPVPLYSFSAARKSGQIAQDKSIRVQIKYQAIPVPKNRSIVMRLVYKKENSLETVEEIVQPRTSNEVREVYLPKSGTVTFEAVEVRRYGATWSTLGPVELNQLNKAVSFSLIQKTDGSYSAKTDKN